MRITPTLDIDETELEERFVRASGPGGQNVNKVSTAVELRFNLVDRVTPEVGFSHHSSGQIDTPGGICGRGQQGKQRVDHPRRKQPCPERRQTDARRPLRLPHQPLPHIHTSRYLATILNRKGAEDAKVAKSLDEFFAFLCALSAFAVHPPVLSLAGEVEGEEDEAVLFELALDAGVIEL